MTISLRDYEGISIIEVSGDLHFSNWEELADQAQALSDLGHTKVIISWENVRFIDSSALGALLCIHKLFSKKPDGKAVIFTPHEDHQTILEQAHFHTILDIQTSMDSAMKSILGACVG